MGTEKKHACTLAGMSVPHSPLPLSPSPSSAPASPCFEVPRTLDQLRNAGLIKVGSVVQHVSAKVIPLHAIRHPITFQSSGNRLRIIRIPLHGQIAAEDASPSPNLDSSGVAVNVACAVCRPLNYLE